jgi:Arc/MetJ-type ribon-helix-helix transcriptional regulator
MDSLTGENGLYPSRSELIRVACREFLVKELEAAKAFTDFHKKPALSVLEKHTEIANELFVKVPIENNELSGNAEYKTYKIIKK